MGISASGLIRAALQKAEAKRKADSGQAESAADTEQQTPEEYAQTVVSEKPHRRQKTCKARRWTQDESATVNFGFYRKSASVANHTRRPAPLKQKVPPLRRECRPARIIPSVALSAKGAG